MRPMTQPPMRSVAEEFARLAAPDCTTCAVFTDPYLPDNPIVYATKAFFTLTGYGPQDVIGRNCRFLQGPETDPAAVQRLREALKSEAAIEVELVNYDRQGVPFLNRLRIRPLYDADGALSRFAGYQSMIRHMPELVRSQPQPRRAAGG